MKERILQGALELFLKYGIKSVTMDDIAVQLSVSKKTIYQHFKDKNEIVVLTCQIFMEKEEFDIDQIQKQSVNALDEMVKISTHVKQNIANLNPSILYDLKKYHPDAWEIYIEHRDKCIVSTIHKNLEQGQKEGYYHDDFDANIMTKLKLVEGEIGFDPSIFSPTEFDIASVQIQMFTHFLRGIVTPKGYKLWNELNHEN